MLHPLTISLVQTTITWHHPEANRLHLDGLLAEINNATNIVVLPEMFTTGFTMDVPAAAEPFSDSMNTLMWMQSWASRLNVVLTGSVSVSESGRCYNRLLWVKPDGSFSTYDKRHLFSMASENLYYTAGNNLLVEEWKGWNICPLICYDLRFPVWSRNSVIETQPLYDVLVFVANWPESRRDAWKKLLLARAIENQCFVVGLNRVGTDGNNLSYCGDSSFIDPWGNYLYDLPPSVTEVCSFTLDFQMLKDFREKFPVLNDADRFRME
ncbi:MAG: amidohydrolase [Crocinitomicaceae bacterium]|nr:amidohydrolase [Crocinitomicaceae bacterium]